MTDSSSLNTSIHASRQPTCTSSYVPSSSTDNHFVIAKCTRDTGVTSNQNPTSHHETTEESDTEERVLAVYCRAGKLGAAYYTLQTGELFILDEIIDRPPEFQMFLNLFRQVAPSRILLDGKTQGAFVQLVKKTVFSTDNDDDGTCKLIFITAKEYSFEACKRRTLSLSLPHEPDGCSDEERALFLRTALDLSQTQSVHALGALLRYLDLNWASLAMDLHAKPLFLSLRKISLADIVTLDDDTYRGLQIFSTLAHPSGFRRGARGAARDGLSLYRLFARCSSRLGQARMRILLQHPTTNLETLKRRQDVIAFFMKPQSDPLMRNICSSLRYIKNVNGILAKIKALSAKAYQWKSLYNTLYNAILICEMCENAVGGGEFLEQLASCDNNELYEMALYMNRIIDFDLTKSEGKFTVKAGVDPQLDRKKQTMGSLHGLMSESARAELARLPGCVRECAMLYLPHLGYLLAVRAWAGLPGQHDLPGMRFMVSGYDQPPRLMAELFQNNDYIHYKSKGCEELDALIGDAYPEIVAHETRIMMRLADVALRRLGALSALADRCAELDCLIAIAKVCKEHNFVRPELTRDRVISIRQGRHPLLAATCDTVVPNDADSGPGSGVVKILTGPNSSGKSVYMKQIGLIVYLAHIGSFVPAERATLGAVARIHSRIQSAECVAAHMSAFLIDLRQMALALQESTPNSLLIIDEFGKGTSEADGLALLAAALNSFLLRGDDCPHLLLSTHFLDVHKYLVETPIVQHLRFEHAMEDGCPVFLFRVTEGTAETSFAQQVAAASGIHPHVVQRAKQVLACLANNTLPPENKKIIAKLRSFTEITKNELLAEDI